MVFDLKLLKFMYDETFIIKIVRWYCVSASQVYNHD